MIWKRGGKVERIPKAWRVKTWGSRVLQGSIPCRFHLKQELKYVDAMRKAFQAHP